MFVLMQFHLSMNTQTIILKPGIVLNAYADCTILIREKTRSLTKLTKLLTNDRDCLRWYVLNRFYVQSCVQLNALFDMDTIMYKRSKNIHMCLSQSGLYTYKIVHI